MQKKYLFGIIPLGLGVSCFVAYSIIGSSVAADGTLIEPFALIPIGWLFFCIGVIASVLLSLQSLFAKK